MKERQLNEQVPAHRRLPLLLDLPILFMDRSADVDASNPQSLAAVLALEIAPQSQPARSTLSRDEAAELAALIAADLQSLLPQVSKTRLSVAGAVFDTVELLRPGFPVWATLDDLARRVPRGHLDHVVAFGAHDDQMPAPALQPDTAYTHGPMRLLPISLLAPPEMAVALGEQLEIELVGRGEASALTADWLMRTLDMRLEHARYLSRNDLLALTCVQYEHVNLAPLWSLLETALLTPYRDEHTLSARGLALDYRQGKVIAQAPTRWLATQESGLAQRAHELAGAVFELRQYAALLRAHSVPFGLEGDASTPAEASWLTETLAEAKPDYDAPMLFAHEAAGLGVVAVTVAQRIERGTMQVLAHAYPLEAGALGALLAHLSTRYATASELHALGKVLLDEHGQLGAPVSALH